MSTTASEGLWELLERPENAAKLFAPRVGNKGTGADATDFDIPVSPEIRVGARRHCGPAAATPILLFHGGGENVPDYDRIVDEYRRAGLSLFVTDYRGYGWSSGKPSARFLHEDALRIAEFFLGRLGPGAPRPLVFGRSLGSICALEVALRFPDRFLGLILESAFSDAQLVLSAFGMDVSAFAREIAANFSNSRRLQDLALPALILHGENDELFPAGMARENHAAVPHARKALCLIPGAGHNDILSARFRGRYFAAIRDFHRSQTPEK